METKLFYSQQEKKTFLEKRGYTIELVDSFEMHSRYHNQVYHTDEKVWIAYLGHRPSEESLKGDVYSLESRYGIDKTFNEELHNAILAL